MRERVQKEDNEFDFENVGLKMFVRYLGKNVQQRSKIKYGREVWEGDKDVGIIYQLFINYLLLLVDIIEMNI